MNNSYLMNTYQPALKIEYGKGIYLFDSKGKKYIDFISGIGSCTLGHGNKKISKVIYQQSLKIINASNLFTTKYQIKLARKLSEVSGLDKCFFSNSGTEAMECAIKLSKKYTQRNNFISMKNGFHGRTLGSLSATWKEQYKKPFYPLIKNFQFVEYGNIEHLKKMLNDDIAAVIVEPIQGEAGVIVPPKGYLSQLSELARLNKSLLIIDEVQTGNGRTGKYFCYQHENILPDILTTAKGLGNGIPIGATISKKDIDFDKGDHGSTFGGNALSCSVALKTLQIIESRLEDITNKGNYFMNNLLNIKKVEEIRGKGLMIGIKIKNAPQVVQKAQEEGLLINAINSETIRFLPPLTISLKEISEGLEILEKSIKEVIND